MTRRRRHPQRMAEDTIMASAMASAPTTMASAVLCSSMISFHRLYGVTFSKKSHARPKMARPSTAQMSADTIEAQCRSGIVISFASRVGPRAAVRRAVGAGVVAHRLRHVLHLVHVAERPSREV